MGSPPRTPREEEQRLNMRTLVIASAASATAALVTSRLWIAGTWIAAALTPVMVTLISEMLRRPTERIARGITVDRAALPDPEAPAAARPETAAAQRVAERLRGDELLPDPDAPPRQEAPPSGARAHAGAPPAPTRVYRSESASRAPVRRKIAYRVVLATAGIAFLIGAFTLTLGELVGGGSVGNNARRTTLIGGGSSKKQDSTQDQQTPKKSTPDQTDTEQQPTTTTEEPTTPETETTTTPTTPEQPPAEPLPGESTTTTPAQP
jgi:hypothetical protein